MQLRAARSSFWCPTPWPGLRQLLTAADFDHLASDKRSLLRCEVHNKTCDIGRISWPTKWHAGDGGFLGLGRSECLMKWRVKNQPRCNRVDGDTRSEEHTSELQSLRHLVCRLL